MGRRNNPPSLDPGLGHMSSACVQGCLLIPSSPVMDKTGFKGEASQTIQWQYRTVQYCTELFSSVPELK